MPYRTGSPPPNSITLLPGAKRLAWLELEIVKREVGSNYSYDIGSSSRLTFDA